MVYQVDNMSLNCIRDVFKGEVNDVYVCQDIMAPLTTYYTVLKVKKHETAKELLESFETYSFSPIGVAADSDGLLVVFPYRQERKLDDFYMGETYSIQTCETICINLIMECISCGLPYPLLYLILRQSEIHLQKDNSVYFGFSLDLSQFEKRRVEKDCVVKCASIVLDLLADQSVTKAVSYELMSRKVPRQSYQRFTELYKDVKMAADSEAKAGIFKRLKAFLSRNSDTIFRIFIVLCSILAITAIILILTQLIFGDVGFLRIFVNTFKKIGTESMLQ